MKCLFSLLGLLSFSIISYSQCPDGETSVDFVGLDWALEAGLGTRARVPGLGPAGHDTKRNEYTGPARVPPGARPGLARVPPGARPGPARDLPGACPGPARGPPGARPGPARRYACKFGMRVDPALRV